MLKTKHDLSANTAKLNLSELIKTAEIAVARSRWDCEQALSKLQTVQLYRENKDVWRQTYDVASAANDLAEASAALAQATNTLHYLVNAQGRDEITVEK